jgi:PhnB protein
MTGFLRGRVFQRPQDEKIEFLVVTEWTSWDAIRAFAGDDVNRAVVEPAAQASLTDFDERVDHFELVDEVAAAGSQPVIPMIAYEDGCAALDWLARAFGFVERARVVRNGLLVHGEMKTSGGGTIILATPTPDYQCPRRHRESCDAARAWSAVPWVIDGLLVYVDDVEGHIEKARAAGAVLLSDLEKGPPGSRYRAEDLEGHRWMFMQRHGSS